MAKISSVRIGGRVGRTTEYLCFGCKQLRLSFVADKSKCMNCGSVDIIVGECGELDKEGLLKARSNVNKESENGTKDKMR